ncbi:MAG TPA: protein kinase [Gemmatimonadales bacterium]|jgi:serine/threonine-protein kinase|nr:protein kinase [Gemmatimonadales bacterium]
MPVTLAPAALADALKDRYTLERELGRGGMAVVYLARDLRHERPVALKVLDAALVPALGAERFQREIRFAARLQHPHILTVLDSGDAAGHLWFTMPYVEGESLRARLKREGALPLEDALRITREVADGLEYAHRQGVIHRDIKPENILLSAGHALIADFGIARALAGGRTGEQSSGRDATLTNVGVSLGTPAYMSPEQASGDPLDGRTDVYSLACVCYEMFAGAPAFTGPTAQAVLAKHFSGEVPSLHEARPDVPPAVEAAIGKALAPDPDQRFATAAEFAAALAGAGAGTTAVSAPVRQAPRRRALAAIGVAVLLTLAAALAFWLPGRGGKLGRDAGPTRLAVLPFENVGDAEDEYFADGVADAVRGKLSALPGIQVIASSSSDQYRSTTKSLAEIGRELGAQYLLVGKVRWQKQGTGESRVQVSPELIQAASGTTRWQQPFDAPLEDVFRVQGDIATRVAAELDLALATDTRAQMAERPTRNLAAYDAFLRGERLSNRVGVTDVDALVRAIGAYEEAISLDSTFGLAWAQLSRALSTLYVNATRFPESGERAGRAAERAVALAPNAPQAHFARALHLSAVRREHAPALEEVNRALKRAPADAELLSMAGLAEQQLGRWNDAVGHFREAQSLDPRSLATARRLARVLLWLRRYPDAREACDYALRISTASPDVMDLKVASYLGQGDLDGARAAIRDAPRELDPTRLMAHIAGYFNLYWVLDDEQQQRLLRVGPDAFENDRSEWALTLAQVRALRGDTALARVYGDTASIELMRMVAANPNDGYARVTLGLAHALAGRRAEAVREGELGVRREPVEANGITGPLVQHFLVAIYVRLGDYEAALDRLEPLLRIPYFLSPAWLRIDPTFAPLRNHPRFKRLAAAE